MASIFTKIVNGEIPSHKVAETDEYFAFLDIFPLVKGHTLVIPKKEVDKLFDLDDETYAGLFTFSKKVADGILRAYPCDRVSLSVIGLEVPHAHVHLIPINTMSDMDFTKPKLKLSQEELAASATLIRSHLSL